MFETMATVAGLAAPQIGADLQLKPWFQPQRPLPRGPGRASHGASSTPAIEVLPAQQGRRLGRLPSVPGLRVVNVTTAQCHLGFDVEGPIDVEA